MDSIELKSKLEQIAALASSLPYQMSSPIGFDHGDKAAFDALAAMEGARLNAHVSVGAGDPHVIVAVRVEIGGCQFKAQYERPATTEEAERAQSGGRSYPDARWATVQP